ncbi:MAG TPA: serine hydrolase [Pyrinomonadaceae bacterium]|jgi:CubicO group peptidase (beta-lactamase class C family)
MHLVKKTLGFYFLYVFIFQPIIAFPAHAQMTSTDNSKKSNDLVERMRRVENGLIPPFRIKGEKVEKWNIAERMKHYKVPGLSVAVINNGVVEWAKGYGEREAGTNLPVTTETLFQAASISKPVAATVALKMVEDKKLSLDEDVNNKLVSWKVPENEFTKEKKVTLRALLSHTAGTSVSGFPGYAATVKTLPTVVEILDGTPPANTKPVRVEAPIGKEMNYSGGGITIIQQLLTDVSKKSFPALANETVLNKVGMKNSTYEQPLPQRLQSQAAAAHNDKGEMITGRWHAYPEMAAAGLWTTPTDLARFAVELQQAYKGVNGKFLAPETVRQMFIEQIGGWGLGVGLSGKGEAARFTHGGSNEGYRCTLVTYKENGKGAVIMTNSDNGDALVNEVLRSIAAEYEWTDFLAPEKTVVKLYPKIFDAYTGKYQFGTAGQFSVSSENGKLFLRLGTEKKYELFAESETHFFVKEMPLLVSFVKDSTGRVTEMINIYNGQEYRLKKV